MRSSAKKKVGSWEAACAAAGVPSDRPRRALVSHGKERRLELGLTQYDVAERLGSFQALVSYLECKQTDPRVSLGSNAEVLVFLLLFGKDPKLRVPLRFKLAGHQSIGRVNAHTSASGQVGFILSALDLLAAQAVGFIGAPVELVLDGKSDLDR